MISRWPIRNKLFLGIALLLITIGALSVTSFVGVYAFRGLAKSLRLRTPELAASSRLSGDVSRLKVTVDLYQRVLDTHGFQYFHADEKMLKNQFTVELVMVAGSFQNYRQLIEQNQQAEEYKGILVHAVEQQQAVEAFQTTLDLVRRTELNASEIEQMSEALTQLEELATQLPTFLHMRLANFADDARGQYRAWIAISAATAFVSLILLLASLYLFYVWIFLPLRVVIHGSRRVASGDFNHHIQLDSQDEMAELASAMNGMTNRFREIRDDLDQQVKQRTKEVVRGEQLASVGFLAAGVAHEINNPLASIALCAESLEERLLDVFAQQSPEANAPEPSTPEANDPAATDLKVVREYLGMMQDEAFRCKEITERLLDFSRLGDVEKQHVDLTDLVRTVIEMVQHIGKYKAKTISFETADTVFCPINPQEMKQVVLNLLTNALDSLDPGGQVSISIRSDAARATLVVRDDGCGMTSEVQEHLFEPFFTRRRDGQGTGLGMSITYRIVNDHGGDITAFSEGPGQGSTITVSLPLTSYEQEQEYERQAA